MNIDDLLTQSSKEIFSGLEEGQFWILRFLAESGKMNMRELGDKISSGYAGGFDRWGVKKRLYGTRHYHSLIGYDYVYPIRINKKETQYYLTLKGLMASLVKVSFNDHFLIKRYKKYILKYSNQQKTNDLLEFIKLEISYLLYSNVILGINWFKFRFIKKFLENNRNYEKANYHLELGIDEEDYLSQKQKSIYNKLQIKYGHFYKQSRFNAYYYTPDQVFREWKKSQIKKSDFKSEIEESIMLNTYTKHWFKLIDLQKIDMNTSELVWSYLNTNGFDVRQKLINMKKDDLKLLFQNRQNKKYLTSFMSFVRLG